MKRFTETTKWSDPWFRRLTPIQKMVFIYFADNCNNAGFCELDIEATAFDIGATPLEVEGAIKGLSRGIIGASGWVWVKNFLRHQKNDSLNAENPAHRQIIGLINDQVERFSSCPVFVQFLSPFQGATKGLKSPIGKGKGQGAGQGEGKGSAEGKGIPTALSSQPGFAIEWSAFKEHRQRIRKPLTEHASGLILTTLCERPDEAVFALQEAMKKGWQGVDWSWIDNAKRSGGANGTGGLDKSRTIGLKPDERPLVWNPMDEEGGQ